MQPIKEESPEPVYCQIADQDITPSTCAAMQGQPECWGCGAPTRRCESCKEQEIGIPETGLCTDCLAQTLQSEAAFGYDSPDEWEIISCQMIDRTLYVRGCLRLQGQEGCGNCAAHSRLCEACGIRKVFFAFLGRCATCTVIEYDGEATFDDPTIRASIVWTRSVRENFCGFDPVPVELFQEAVQTRHFRGSLVALDETSGPILKGGLLPSWLRRRRKT